MVAAHRLFSRCDAPTITATGTLPVVERDIRTARVIGLQNLANEHEEVVNAALLKCPANSQATFSFAEQVVLHMRVRHAAVGFCWAGIQSDNTVGMSGSELRYLERDLETSQLDTVQCDGWSYYRKHSLARIVANLVKLLGKRSNLAPYVSERRRFGVFLQRINGAS